MARFKREAQVLVSLNHPNIAAIHGAFLFSPMATRKLENYLRASRRKAGLTQREVAFLLGHETRLPVVTFAREKFVFIARGALIRVHAISILVQSVPDLAPVFRPFAP